jgi:hypothetical protein
MQNKKRGHKQKKEYKAHYSVKHVGPLRIKNSGPPGDQIVCRPAERYDYDQCALDREQNQLHSRSPYCGEESARTPFLKPHPDVEQAFREPLLLFLAQEPVQELEQGGERSGHECYSGYGVFHNSGHPQTIDRAGVKEEKKIFYSTP